MRPAAGAVVAHWARALKLCSPCRPDRPVVPGVSRRARARLREVAQPDAAHGGERVRALHRSRLAFGGILGAAGLVQSSLLIEVILSATSVGIVIPILRTNPPTGPHPISTTAAGGAGIQARTNGRSAACHRLSGVTPPQPAPAPQPHCEPAARATCRRCGRCGTHLNGHLKRASRRCPS